MPGRDRTGPLGQGPMTGWGRGFCGRGAYAGAGFFGGRGWRGRGCGWGWGYGRGRGWGTGMPMGGVWQEPMSEAEERAMMEQELAMTEARANELRARLGREGDE
ncbi:MAG: DUF5320 domain-containing protein [Synergistaceae bacterium]|nr:DUF5320 domain-containing protein [Synergistota bacterium]NLM70985.1 DUF5320 domain-containing protein [Synergistaceae bacterium]